MGKIRKQITVNVTLIIVSCLTIFISKTFAKGQLLAWNEYLGTDIVFVMITSMVATISWRFIENIVGHWLYNIIVSVILFIFAIEYGTSMVNTNNNALFVGILVSIIVFLVFYVIENSIIVYHFRKVKRNKQVNKIYNRH